MPSDHRSVRAAFAVASMALLLFASCSHPRVGVTVGIVYRGGPAPGNSNVLQPGTIRIFASNGALKASEHVREGDALRASLVPGDYTVEAQSGDARCLSRTITISGDAHALVRIACSVR